MVHSRHSLLVALVVTTIVVTVALSWAGWRLLSQQRAIDEQGAQRQLKATAESMVAGIRGKLAETGERLSAAVANPAAPLPTIAGAAVITTHSDGTVIAAAGGLPFVPAVSDSAATDAVFTAAEALELTRADVAAAASRYRILANQSDPAIRAGALLRYARVAEQRGDTSTALRTYQQLEQSGDVRVKHLPARFIALYQQHAIARARGDVDRERQLKATLAHGLDAGEWLITRGVAAFYRDELEMRDLPPAWPLAEAIEHSWQPAAALPPRGQRVFNDGPRSILVMWRASGSVTAMMAAFLDGFLPAAPRDTTWRLEDPAARWIAGERAIPQGAAAPLVVGDSEYAWLLHVGSTSARDAARSSELTLIAMMAAMLTFLWGAMYFMARAIRREAAVLRLQSDFVAAVSHEFRSPLTTIRQMAEMLEMGRVVSDERRKAYYNVLTAEALRLQRLVETLLNFGRMEAGAARYRLEDVDLAGVARRVVQEIEPSARESRKRIVASGPEVGVRVRADASALALAVRNLIDNALKYSPEQSEIRVEWASDEGHALIRVIDPGIGIPLDEQQTIFGKFVRGRSAIDTNVAGTGVGLAMVRQILQAHAGEVRVESEVGRGSTFTLVLPLANVQLPIPNSQTVAAAR